MTCLIYLPRVSGVLTLRSTALTLGLAYPLNMPPNTAMGTNDRKSKGRFSINCCVFVFVFVFVCVCVCVTLGMVYPLKITPNTAIGNSDQKSKGRFSIN